jgi:hypothetical protein
MVTLMYSSRVLAGVFAVVVTVTIVILVEVAVVEVLDTCLNSAGMSYSCSM